MSLQSNLIASVFLFGTALNAEQAIEKIYPFPINIGNPGRLSLRRIFG